MKINYVKYWRSFSKQIKVINSSKFFAGLMMIILNIGSRFISVKFSKSTEEYIRNGVTKQVLVFAMSWIASRDIFTSLALTAIFTVLADGLFNDDSKFCIVPAKYRMINKIIDENNDGEIDEAELQKAVKLLELAKQKETSKNQRIALTSFDLNKI